MCGILTSLLMLSLEAEAVMTNEVTMQERVGTARAMYEAYPFPYRSQILSHRNDERFHYIQKEFLYLPIDDFENKTLLDAGCGTGENTWTWNRILDPSARIIAVDLSKTSVRIAQPGPADAPRHPSFAVSSLLDLGLADHSIDLIFCGGVLHHTPDPERGFTELMRILKPGGYIVLVLYHKYGRAWHRLRRAIVNLIAGDDVDRRARVGGLLFGRRMRRIAAREQVPFENVLYDQFGLPWEAFYSVGDVLKLYDSAHVDYVGSWPPAEWSRFGKALRFSHRFIGRTESRLYRLLLLLFADAPEPPSRAPSLFSRATMQMLWACDQMQLFAIAGRKASQP
jgi:SAM-dependent methyltransferase